MPTATCTPTPTGDYRLTNIDWVGAGYVTFSSGSWGAHNQDAALLALDILQVGTDIPPDKLIKAIRGRAGSGALNYILQSGTAAGAGYAAGNIFMYGANLDNAFLSTMGMYYLIHEQVHGIDEYLGSATESFTAQGNYNAVGWSETTKGIWEYTGSMSIGTGSGPASNYSLDGPQEDFAEGFMSVVITQVVNEGRVTSISGRDLSGIIRLTGDQNGDSVIGLDELGTVDDVRRTIILNAIEKLKVN